VQKDVDIYSLDRDTKGEEELPRGGGGGFIHIQ
jgi:hypothetical protein